jgi:hypothetical protein
MNILHSSRWGLSSSRLFCAVACLFPALLSAHPGHYHPDETDEFDFLRATFFHSHGTLDYLLAAVAVFGLVVALFHGKPAVRIAAVVAAAGSAVMQLIH